MPETLDKTPQFATAEYAETPTVDRCNFCEQMIGTTYYRVDGSMACSSCADKAQHDVPTPNRSAFARAALFGVGGALLGLIIYAAFAIITGWMIGYVSLAVGYIVAKAMMIGSKGFGGRRYQITAVLLTYAAVSLAAVPIAISQFAKQSKPAQVETVKPAESAEQTTSQNQQVTTAEGHPQADEKPMSFGRAIGALVLIGLASPFLELADPLHGLIGLVILFVGIQIAWKIAAGKARTEISGPYSV